MSDTEARDSVVVEVRDASAEAAVPDLTSLAGALAKLTLCVSENAVDVVCGCRARSVVGSPAGRRWSERRRSVER